MNRIKSNPQLRNLKQNEIELNQELHALLTVTILEANLKVDMSSFLAKMSTYCSVSLQKGEDTELNQPQDNPTETSKKEKKKIKKKNSTDTLVIVSKRTQNVSGKNPKWSESFAFKLGQMYEFDS